MNEIPLCLAFQPDKIVGKVVLDPEYEEDLTKALMNDAKFNIGATIYHGGDKPKLVLLCFSAVPARSVGDVIDGQCQERKYGVNGVRRCQFAAHHSDPHLWGDWE